ncbi:MAG TPA: methyltransferase domain-containing protein, partial [Solirubrobacteraceae bacterium]|nr:methyltransferase domain-containing protein [Solirubrobacteraceae bacterium]
MRARRLAARLDAAALPEPVASAWSALRRERAARRATGGRLRAAYPATADELRASPLLREWWYYGVELLPGVFTEGHQPAVLPMLPRMLLRNCDVAGAACLDVGSMEGVVPVLLRKRGAEEVLAVDYSYAAAGRLAAVQHYHGVDFEFRSVGLMYELARRLRSRSFDLVNLSGVLYHVFSPLHLLAAVRPLMRRNGLLVVSTYATLDPLPVMDFNARGRMWAEGNTFWFPSVALLDYLLRYLRLEPVDCLFRRLEDMSGPAYGGLRIRRDFEKPAGYVSVVCRAVDSADGDAWIEESTGT